MTSRTLTLKRETLAELGAEDLRVVAGGSPPPTYYTCLTQCGVCEITGVLCPATLPSIDVVCS